MDQTQHQRYIPTAVLDHWLHHEKFEETAQITLPAIIQEEQVVIVILDLSGYTKATRLLIEQAEQSVDQQNASQFVGSMVKHCLDPLFDLVLAHGGDVLKYGGDALFCLWRSQSPMDLQKRVEQALSCCIQSCRQVRQFPMSDFHEKVIPLGIHAVIHCGSVDLLHLGDLNSKRLECVCYGHNYLDACNRLNDAPKDQVYVTRDVANVLEMESKWTKRFPYVSSVKQQPSGDFLLAVNVEEAAKNTETEQSTTGAQSTNPNLLPLSYYVDNSVLARLQFNDSLYKQNGSISPQIRQCSVVFLHANPIQENTETTTMAWSLNELLTATLQTLYRGNELVGIMRQMSIDDKGISLLLVFGLPPTKSEDPCIAAATVVLSLLRTINVQKLPFQIGCGLCTGRLFSGTLGRGPRMEHAILGSAVNMAARFMMLAESNQVLCDEVSSKFLQRFHNLFQCSVVPPMTLKGWKDPVPTWHVQYSSGQEKQKSEEGLNIGISFHDEEDDETWQSLIDAWCASDKSVSQSIQVIGRETESSADLLARNGIKSTFVIEAPSGAGKSVTARRMTDYLSKKHQLQAWTVSTFEIEQTVPFSGVRQLILYFVRHYSDHPLIVQWLKENDSKDVLQAIGHVILEWPKDRIHSLQELYDHLTFAKSALARSSVPSTQASPRLNSGQPDQLLQTITDALVQLMQSVSKQYPKVIVMDDCQWQDPFTWAITAALSVRCKSYCILVLVSRPGSEYADPTLRQLYEKIINRPFTHRLELMPVGLERVQNIVKQWFPGQNKELVVKQISEKLLELASGNAFALDVLLRHWSESLSGDSNPLEKSMNPLKMLPTDTKSVFVAQLDKLDPTFQRIVRTAALIGQVFYMSDVLGLCRFNQVEASQIVTWDRFNFMEQLEENDNHQPRWRFKHCLIQFQIYSLMTADERFQRQKEMVLYFDEALEKDSSRASDLLPLLLSLNQELNDEEHVFQIACRMIPMYDLRDMRFECQRQIQAVYANQKRYSQLPEEQKARILRTGIRIAYQLDDLKMFKQFLYPCAQTFAGIKLKQCMLFLVFQLISTMSRNEAYWKKRKANQIMQEPLSAQEMKKWDIFMSIAYDTPDSPHDVQIGLMDMICIMHSNNGAVGDYYLVERMVANCGVLFFLSRTSTAEYLFHELGLDTLDESTVFMKQLQFYETLSCKELERRSVSFEAVIKRLAHIYNMFRVNNERAFMLAIRFWKLAEKHNSLKLMDATMHLGTIVWPLQAIHIPDYPLFIYVREKRLESEANPAATPPLSVTVNGCSGYLMWLSENLNDAAPEELNFALEFCKTHCPPLNAPVEALTLQMFSTVGCVFHAIPMGHYDEACDYMSRLFSAVSRFEQMRATICYGLTMQHVCRMILWVLYHVWYPDEKVSVPTLPQYQAFLTLIKSYIGNVTKLCKSPKTWSSFQCTKIPYFQARGISYILQVEEANVQSYTLLENAAKDMEMAVQVSKEMQCRNTLSQSYEFLFFIKKKLLPTGKKIGKEEDAEQHFQSAMKIHEEAGKLWTMRHLQRIHDSK